MIEKKLLEKVLRHIKKGAVRLTYWDGSEVVYGEGKPLVHVTIKTPQSRASYL